MSENTSRRIHPLAIIGALLFAALIVALAFFIFNRSAQQAPIAPDDPVFNITVFPAPTQTPTVFVPTQLPSPTIVAPDILPEGTFGIGSYVKVIGTSGLGLNIRAAAGRGQVSKFLAFDDEMFEIIGGPVVLDDLTWWELEAPMDESRNGWAAENYLERIKQDEP